MLRLWKFLLFSTSSELCMSQNTPSDPQRLVFAGGHEQMASGIWPEQEISIPAWSTRWVIKPVPPSEKCWSNGIHKEGSQIPSQVCSKSPRRQLLSASLLFEGNKERHHSLPVPRVCPFPPNTFGKRRNCSNLNISPPPPVTYLQTCLVLSEKGRIELRFSHTSSCLG